MRKFIPVQELFDEWKKDPEFKAIYDDSEEDWNLVNALYSARIHAGLTQEQVAMAMGTTGAAMSRLVSGRGNPSFLTLRRYAAATNTRVRVIFEPIANGIEENRTPGS